MPVPTLPVNKPIIPTISKIIAVIMPTILPHRTRSNSTPPTVISAVEGKVLFFLEQ